MITTERVLAIVPDENRPGKKDVTGAFLPEAIKWVKHYGGDPEKDVARFPAHGPKPKRRKVVEAAIWENRHDELMTRVAFFCHGYKSGLQTGHTVGNVEDLARVIARRSVREVTVTLYACDAARDNDPDRADDLEPGPGGDGGFADMLRDELSALGCRDGWVDGHTVVAHTTKAPFVRRFYTDGTADGLPGGDWVVAPRSPQWKDWRRALRGITPGPAGQLRFSFPSMSIAEIHRLLST